jgi:glycerol-3-phosphate acyltransferase PlsY
MMIILGQMGVFGAPQPVLNEIYIIQALFTILVFWKHRANIGRLLSGKESKTYLFKKK